MGIGKSFSQVVKSKKDLATAFQICQKLCDDGGLKITSKEFQDSSFFVKASEPMKWLSTNYPNEIQMTGEVLEGQVMVRLVAQSGGWSLTQERNISDFLDNFAKSLSAYVGE